MAGLRARVVGAVQNVVAKVKSLRKTPTPSNLIQIAKIPPTSAVPTFRQRLAARGASVKAKFVEGGQKLKNLSRGKQIALGVGTAGAIGGAGVVNHRRNKRNKTQFRRR